MRIASVLVMTLALAASAFGQTTNYGDPNFVLAEDWRSGWPEVTTIDAQDVGNYAGGTVEIPFTLNGSGATIWLAVYTKDANPQYDGQPFGIGGPGGANLRAAGLDTLVFVSAGQEFPEGANSIEWDGTDWTGAQMPAGKYDFYVFALDRQANPTYCGGGQGPWETTRIDTRPDPPEVWWPKNDGAPFLQSDGETEVPGWAIHRSVMGMDWLANPEGYETFDIPWYNERLGKDTDWKDVGAYAVDPSVENVGYILGMDNDPNGLWRVNFDPEAGTILPDETSWPSSDRGYIDFNYRLFNIAITNDFHHPWVQDDGMLYFSWTDRVAPLVPAIVQVDRATGEVVEIIDYSDFYLDVYVTDEGEEATYTPGPGGVDVDEEGIYTSGYWMTSGPVAGMPWHDLPSFPLKRGWDGNIIWQNRNGDFFIDRWQGEEAEAMGVNPVDQMVNVNCKTGRWGISFWSGYNVPQWAEVLGPDGAGLFKINVDRMPGGLGGEVWWMDNDSNIDGLYIVQGYATQMVHWPFDVDKAMISDGAVTAVAEVSRAGVPSAYALDGNYPNPFNAETTIRFAIPDVGAQHTTITIYNMTGQEIVTLVDGEYAAGFYNVTWDGRDANGNSVGSGVYLYNLTVGDQFSDSQRMTLLK